MLTLSETFALILPPCMSLLSVYKRFVDDDIVSTTTSSATEDINYQATDSIIVIENSDLVDRSFLMITPEHIQNLRVK